MARARNGNVIVITGASAGIGRATASEFARLGARLVLTARGLDGLKRTAEICRGLGAECFIIEADVSKMEEVQRVADKAVETWQRIDVWINNAGVASIGVFSDIEVSEHRRVIETNLMGYIHGAHAALNVFKNQGHGTLINNGSVCSVLAVPQLASYTASKFAVRGLTHALQQDLRMARETKIRVCQVNPGVVDTSAIESAPNHSGKDLKLTMPKTSPEAVARKIVRLSRTGRPESFVGFLAWLGGMASRFVPTLTEGVLRFMMRRFYFQSPG